ncbi:hypothetical protein HYALB_00000527 [Hymenoscyphus albidus]|uniref:Uncharacterized protein n=1 Tax=Hymenoscyphus albidus TaxID=595503 RepID=A0A9N9LXZ6_9HELO|nr:hypothetical protein HYALB_00000527 [Hymenoscyphus albidus]
MNFATGSDQSQINSRARLPLNGAQGPSLRLAASKQPSPNTLSSEDALSTARRTHNTLNEAKSRLDDVNQHFDEQLAWQRKFSTESRELLEATKVEGLLGSKEIVHSLYELTHDHKRIFVAHNEFLRRSYNWYERIKGEFEERLQQLREATKPAADTEEMHRRKVEA